jgi:predicted cobalt transporter CbtA
MESSHDELSFESTGQLSGHAPGAPSLDVIVNAVVHDGIWIELVTNINFSSFKKLMGGILWGIFGFLALMLLCWFAPSNLAVFA